MSEESYRPDGPRPVRKSGASALDTAIWALESGLWPVVITPADAKGPAPGKRPIGQKWGVDRPTEQSLRAAFKRTPNAGVGLKLGAEGGVIDIDVDDPEAAEPVLARLFPEGTPDTLGWVNADGRFHLLFRYDERLASFGKSIIKGQVRTDGEIVGNPHYLGLEIRIGAAPGDAKQLQSVIPPSLMANGKRRKWVGTKILPFPESILQDLEAHARPSPAEPAKPAPGGKRYRRDDGHDLGEMIENRIIPYLKRCDPAVEGSGGHNQTFKVCVKVGPGYNLDPEVAFRLLWDEYNPRCLPPWSERDLRHKVDQAYKVETRRGWIRDETRNGYSGGGSKPPRKPPTAPKPESEPAPELAKPTGRLRFEATDLGNAHRLVRDHGEKLRYCGQWGKWLFYDSRRWQQDDTGHVYRLAMKTVRGIATEAAAIDDDAERNRMLKWAITSQSRKAIDAMVHLARFVEGIPVQTSDLNRDPWLLNVQNGTIDLQTGRLRPHRQGDMITKLAPVDYDPNATCPRWEQFELEIMDGNVEMVEYLRRVIGYGMTADVREHALFFLYGDGRNGKSLLLGTTHEILGDYATTVDASLITSKNQDDHPTGLTDLEGARFVSTIEVADGKKLAEALVKKLTGGDPIKARRMRQDFYQFKPTHKLILAANHKPEIKGTDRAIWERIKLIGFPITFADPDDKDFGDPTKKIRPKDKTLDKTLMAEMPGILALMVRSCMAWQRDGLQEPAAVKAATAAYRVEMDDLADFIGERCVILSGVRVLTSNLYEAYAAWTKAAGLDPIKKRAFGTEMTRRGFQLQESSGKSFRLGIQIRDDSPRMNGATGAF